MKTLISFSHALNRLCGGLAIALILYMFVHIIVEIGLRFFGMSTFVLDEFVGYAVAASTFFALGYSLERDGLIRVNVVLDRIAESKRWILDLFASLLASAFFLWVGYYWWLTVARSFVRGTTSQSLAETPLWIPQGLVLVGMGMLCLTLIVRIVALVCYQQAPKPVTQGA